MALLQGWWSFDTGKDGPCERSAGAGGMPVESRDMIVRRSRWKTFPLVLWGLSGIFTGLLVSRLAILIALTQDVPVRAAGLFLVGGALLGGIIGVLWGAMRVRQALAPVQAGNRPLVTIDAEVAAGPLAEQLRALTASLEALGFVRQRDYGLAGPLGTTPVRGFARLLFHPGHQCFAEINAAAGLVVSVELGVSLLTILNDGWSIAAWGRFNPSTAGLHYVRRLPRKLWKIFPGAAPDRLLAEHLAMRDPIIADLGLAIVSSPLPDVYFDEIQRATALRNEAFGHKNIIAYLVEADLYAMHPKMEWLGDYAKSQSRLRL